MIQMVPCCRVADNSGARKIACILPSVGRRASHAGRHHHGAVKEVTPDGNIKRAV
jgi:ribosomal protein L14